ncbi:MAG: phage tail tape measure protein [Lachnospiraceae bacterium]|nr:phage tail tape measure protein [Lachnospiraceae bacterium]
MNVFDLVARILLDTSEYENELNNASGKTSSFADKLKNGLANAMNVGAAALAVATTAVGAFAKASIDTGMQFDSSMSQVAATMGTTVDQITELRDFAMEMGAKTAFSATEAADALNYMALAGYSADESMAALPNVLNLAAAGGIDLAAASDMVTDAQSALGLSMEESAALVDKMAMASSKSNTSVAQLGEAILTIGGTAKNLAGGTTELSTALGILADNGIKGAEGGTALRNIILSLSAPTDTAAKAMAALGLEVYDAEGNMRPLNDTFGDLNAALSSMTQGQQTEVLNTIFNKVDLKSVNALLANTGERFDELSGYIDNAADAAANMANTQLDNLSGDITLFKSALEGAQIVLSDQLTPTLREFVQFGSNGISEIAAAFQEGGLSGAMDAFGAVLSDGLHMIVEHLPTMVDAGMHLLGALGEGLIDNLPTLATSAIQIITTLAEGIVSGFPELQQTAAELFNNFIAYLKENLPQMISAGLESLLSFSSGFRENVGSLVDNAIELIMTLADGIIEALPDLIATVPEIISNFANAINDNAPKLLKSAAELIGKLVKGLVENIPVIIQNMPKIISAIVDTITAFNWINLGTSIIKGLGNGLKSMVSFVKESVGKIAEAIKGGVSQLPTAMKDIGKNIVSGVWQGIQSMAQWIKDKVSGFFGGIVDSVKGLLGIQSPSKVFAGIGGYMAEGLGKGWSDSYRKAEKGILGQVKDTSTAVSKLGKRLGSTAYFPGVDYSNLILAAKNLDKFQDAAAQKIADNQDVFTRWQDFSIKSGNRIEDAFSRVIQKSTTDLRAWSISGGNFGSDFIDQVISGVESSSDRLYQKMREAGKIAGKEFKSYMSGSGEAISFSSVDFQDSVQKKIYPNATKISGSAQGSNLPPITFIVRPVLNGKEIGEFAYNYIQNREKSYGGKY